MSREAIRLPNGHTLGYIETRSNGEVVAKLANGRTVGTYDPRTDKTKLPNGREYGKGNLLAALIIQNQD